MWNCLDREPVSFLRTPVIVADFWPLLRLCRGHKAVRNLEKHQHRRLQLSLSPPFLFHQPLLLLSLFPALEVGVRCLSVLRWLPQGPQEVAGPQSALHLLLGNDSETVLGRCFCLSSVCLRLLFLVGSGWERRIC